MLPFATAIALGRKRFADFLVTFGRNVYRENRNHAVQVIPVLKKWEKSERKNKKKKFATVGLVHLCSVKKMCKTAYEPVKD